MRPAHGWYAFLAWLKRVLTRPEGYSWLRPCGTMWDRQTGLTDQPKRRTRSHGFTQRAACRRIYDGVNSDRFISDLRLIIFNRSKNMTYKTGTLRGFNVYRNAETKMWHWNMAWGKDSEYATGVAETMRGAILQALTRLESAIRDSGE
jgi:hypothetical protein